jgi:hypothetical protein
MIEIAGEHGLDRPSAAPERLMFCS